MKETELKIRTYGDRALRKKAKPVKTIGPEEKALINKMAEIMYSNSGIGLAAPQVGINKQLIIVDVGRGLFKLFNPKIKKKHGSDVMEEGCLSVPGVSVKVKRAKKALFEGLNDSSERVSFWADDLFCRVLLHEIDHLNGKLIVDYANILKKFKIRKKFKVK